MRDETPVLIGAGQFTFRGPAENSPSPLELLKIAAKRAIARAGLQGTVLAQLDALAVVAFSIGASGGLSKLPLPRLGRRVMGRVHVIRHGKPAATWGGQDDDPGLDETGREQARAVAAILSALPERERPARVVSSPLRRCRETAAPLAAILGVPVEIEPAVGEIPTPAALAPEDRPAWLRQAFAGDWADILGDRDYRVWTEEVACALARYEGCAVFSHFVALNAAVAAAQGTNAVMAVRPDHASVTVFEVVDNRLRLVEKGREASTGVL